MKVLSSVVNIITRIYLPRVRPIFEEKITDKLAMNKFEEISFQMENSLLFHPRK